ncbi:hypothetical protein BDY19DRAFT_386412 [Irpex rosettiformis]|uniref:Uncharacterized protein n=1 Tax=Irpex rosettiformis TaxID=378272 RepID=A0ACB8TV67_9APHY|nr:hypothetical protein BDY19DRAFT_386412 [Irpex rosettiformis]
MFGPSWMSTCHFFCLVGSFNATSNLHRWTGDNNILYTSNIRLASSILLPSLIRYPTFAIMLRCLVVLASVLSIITSVQALPVDGSPRADSQPTSLSSEPATLMGRQYQLAKREPLILLDPSIERATSEQRYNHASPASEILRKRVKPFPRYVLERSLDTLEVREIHTPAHTASKATNQFSEPAPPPPLPPHNDEAEYSKTSTYGASTQEDSASRHREAFSHPNSGLGLAGLGLGGSSGTPGVGALGLGASSSGSSGGSGLTALGGLISG